MVKLTVLPTFEVENSIILVQINVTSLVPFSLDVYRW